MLTNDKGRVVVAVDANLYGADRDEEMRQIGSSAPPITFLVAPQWGARPPELA
ncbi:hypothetical protein [Streptomyces venezuelae]|uniref:hypothetical protein n=1 Tax=Streptomyces venezuelae TaxID=54571 RepID=UPI0016811CDB|nr:hypothetical protein [Streptomyces venezuelae]